MNDRAKTTPNSTAGSFAPSAGARSRVEPGERVCECGQPITSKDPAAEVCMHCYYEGKPLAAAFASQIAKLSAATGRGSSAIVVSAWHGGGAHAYNAVNDHGEVKWLDGQSGRADRWPPPYASQARSSWAIVMDSSGKPTTTTP